MSFLRRFFSTKNTLPIEQLESLYKLSTAVNSTKSTLEKYALLEKYPACHSILKRIYDPHLRHHVTAKGIKKYIESYPRTHTQPPYQDLNALLDALSSRTIRGHAASEAVASFYATYCKTPAIQELFWRVMDRNLKMGVSVNTIRHLLTSTKKTDLTHFRVALARNFEPSQLDFKDTWYVSQKLDGVRCLTFVQYDAKTQQYDIQFYSRTGRPFTSLQKVRSELEARMKQVGWTFDFVLDGELCAFTDNSSHESFIEALKQVRRLKEEMENPMYCVFDLIRMDQFLAGKGDQVFSERQQYLNTLVKEALSYVKIVEQKRVVDMKQLENMRDESLESRWEGLMIRKDVPYEGKRTRNMMKWKQWADAEYIVKSIETGLIRTPAGEEKRMMTSVNIDHKGNTVGVGSGFSLQNRIDYANDPSLIIGKPITVQYFSESKKEDGTLSLRFPSVKVVYDNGKRDT